MDIFATMRRDRRIVADWLLYYEERKARYDDQCLNVIHARGDAFSAPMVMRSEMSDPTQQKAMALLDASLRGYHEWIIFVESLESTLPSSFLQLLSLRRTVPRHARRKRGRPAWIPYVQQQMPGSTSSNLARQWQLLLDCAVIVAAKRGLLEMYGDE